MFSSDLPFLLGLSPLDVVLRGPFWAYAGATFIAYMLLWAGGLHFALAFPRPAPILADRRWLIPLIYVAIYGVYALELVIARLVLPDGLSWISAAATAQFTIVLPTIALTVVAGVGAWRRGTAEERRILRWIGITVIVSLAATVVDRVPARGAIRSRPGALVASCSCSPFRSRSPSPPPSCVTAPSTSSSSSTAPSSTAA